MESSNISNWTKEQLKKEVMKLRDQTKTPKKTLNTSGMSSTSTSSQEEIDKYKQQIQEMQVEILHLKELNTAAKSEIEYLRTQNNMMLTNILEKDKIQVQAVNKKERQFYPKFVPKFSKHLVISDSTYKLVQQNDITHDTAIHSYPSAGIKDSIMLLNNTHQVQKLNHLYCILDIIQSTKEVKARMQQQNFQKLYRKVFAS